MNRSLLIAEGDAELCELYRQFLTNSGYNVETARDGLDCLEKLRRLEPALLVLGQELLWGGGNGVLACLREESLLSELPVLLTATAGSPQVFVDFLEETVVDLLLKPFALSALLESVRSALAIEQGPRKQSTRNDVPAYTEMFIG